MRRHFRRGLQVSITIVALSIILGFGLLYYLAGKLSDTANAIVQARLAIQVKNQENETSARLKEDAGKAAKYASAISGLLPDYNQLYDFPNWLDGVARARGVVVTPSFQSNKTDPTPATLGEVGFEMNVVGIPDSVIAFLGEIESPMQTHYIVAIDSIDIARNSDRYQAVTRGRVFFRNVSSTQ